MFFFLQKNLFKTQQLKKFGYITSFINININAVILINYFTICSILRTTKCSTRNYESEINTKQHTLL